MAAVLVELGAVPDLSEVLAAVAVPVQNPEPPPGQGEEFGKSSPIALVVIILLALATVVLIRSMSKHLRKVPASFDEQSGERTEPDADPDTGSAGSGKD
ncbi:hypothetical protein ACVGVM_24515 [Pseudonocardia bannensis]|uniref:Uncharacterized protein n=1 Tax=Pseudonocardia bannensis TaxID=630973 RepID=A0A848DMG1_9PSEU|nr:hypothetical protein [Pseudonocardia bannensis]